MTGPEFAANHGSATGWTVADIEAQQNLAEIDQLPATVAPLPQPTTPAKTAA